MTRPNLLISSLFTVACCVSLGTGCGSDDDGGGSGGTSSGGTGATGGSSGGTGGGTGATGGATGGTAGSGGSAGAAATGGSAGSTSDAGCTGVQLTVKNILSWCSVTVAGGAAFTTAEETVCVPEGATELTATALTGFMLGTAPWHETDGDTGSGEQGTLSGSGQSQMSTVTATVAGGADCVWVCCPFPDGTGCPTTNQCP